MKIVLFSDIHANLPALEAVLDDIDRQNPDMVFCLGDLVGYAPWPNEVVELIRSRHIPTIAGNYDQGVGLNSDDCGCAYKTEEDRARGAESIAFTNKIISDQNREYLRALPAHLRIEFAKDNHLLLVHGSPRKINEYLFADRPDNSFQRMMQKANAQTLASGHTHKPYYRILEYRQKGNARYEHAINIGSVGKPKDEDPRACYTMLEWDKSIDLNNPDALTVTFQRVEYDVEKSAKAIEESILPDAYADMLREAL